jgi:hypothetical protein
LALPFVAYVHARGPDPPEDGGRTPLEPNWRIWRWVLAAIVLSVAATRSSGAVEVVLVLVVFALCCQAAAEALPNGDGMREWRQ